MTTATLEKQEVSNRSESVQERFNRAMKTLRSVGVTTRLNVSSCCRSCAELPEGALIWTFGGQGGAYSWFNGRMVDRNTLARIKRNRYGYVTEEGLTRGGGLVDTLYIYHSDKDTAEAAKLALELVGLTVVWDGSEDSALMLKPQA